MKSMVSADTNVLLRWVLNDLPEQATMAASLLEGSDDVRIDDGAVIEMVYVLQSLYRLDRSIIADYVRSILALGQVSCDRSLFAMVLGAYEQYPRLSIMDCYLAAKARQSGAEPLFTFDKQLAKKLESAELLA